MIEAVISEEGPTDITANVAVYHWITNREGMLEAFERGINVLLNGSTTGSFEVKVTRRNPELG